MPQIISLKDKNLPAPSSAELCQPFQGITGGVPPPESQSNKPLALSFGDQLRVLIFYHPEEHTSGRHLPQVPEEDDFARETVAPAGGIRRSIFFETLNTRGLNSFSMYTHPFGLMRQHLFPPVMMNSATLSPLTDH